MGSLHGRARIRARRLAGALLACALVGVAGPWAGASTQSTLDNLSKKLAALESQIADQQKSVDSVSARLRTLTEQLAARQAQYDQLVVRSTLARDDLDATRAEYLAIRGSLDDRARQVYMNGPGAGLELFLGASTLGDLSDAIEFQDRLAQHDSELAAQAQGLTDLLAVKAAKAQGLADREASTVKDLQRRQGAVVSAFTDVQSSMDELRGTKIELEALIQRVAAKLRADQLAAARSAIGTGMTVTFGDWAGHLLDTLKAPQCQDNLVALVAWETAEYTQASWNPLATTYPMPGATNFNSVGVKNYRTLDDGLSATVGTLRKGAASYGYGDILGDLGLCATAMSTGGAINASSWCRGCANGTYVVALIPVVEAYYEQYASK